MAENLGKDLRIGIDIGGTFTDFVYISPGSPTLHSFKLPSTPVNPALAVLDGIRLILDRHDPSQLTSCTIIHGSTVATNALLERKGAPTALIATRGFGDVLQIGRQNRPSLYDLSADPAPVLVPADRRFEVSERVDSHGQVLIPLDLSGMSALLLELDRLQVESAAVCLIFSFLNPEHETMIVSRLREAGFFVSASSEVLPEFREYERTSTTVVNAYITPVVSRYLNRLIEGIPQSARLNQLPEKLHLQVMQSNGGMISLEEASRSGVRCLLSGPAGGIIGALRTGRTALSPASLSLLPLEHRSGWDVAGDPLRLITFDMGGTSTDVSLINGEPAVTTETVIGGCPVRLPLLDIHTIGAGGGSIASVDLGGALRVGPESAGADPGPACCSRGDPNMDLPTVTDANLLLGRLLADRYLGGSYPLDVERSRQVFRSLGGKLGMDEVEAAAGVIEVVNAHMERLLRLISVERGHDPRSYTLLSFGGAGGLHAVDLAQRMGISRVLIPRLASTLSAFGMLGADVVKDYSQTVMLSGTVSAVELENRYQPLLDRGFQDILVEGIAPEYISLERIIDLRYRGQSYELTLPYSQEYASAFNDSHRALYGYSHPSADIEIVNIRVKAVGKVPHSSSSDTLLGEEKPPNESSIDGALLGNRPVYLHGGWLDLPVYQGELLSPGVVVSGPALVACEDTTVLVGLGWDLDVVFEGFLLRVSGYTQF